MHHQRLDRGLLRHTVWLLIFAAVCLQRADSLRFVPVFNQTDRVAFNYVVESRMYPEDPGRVYLTLRGGGITVLDVRSSAGASPPPVVARWDTNWTIEGQDRRGGTLVVTELGRSPNETVGRGPHLHLFRLGQGGLAHELSPFRSVNLSSYIDAVLHVKLHQSAAGDLWALCTGGFATRVSGALVAVRVQGEQDDATDEVHVLSTPIAMPEGIEVVGGAYAYVGGINSSDLAVVDVDNPACMRVVRVIPGLGAQLVAGAWRDQRPFPVSSGVGRIGEPAASLLFLADWAEPGGLVAMNVSFPGAPVTVAAVRSMELARANRVKLVNIDSRDFALLPLEQNGRGGVAAVDVTNATSLGLIPAGEARVPTSATVSNKVYCVAITEQDIVLVFVAETATMYGYGLRADESESD